jgi:hypothetical protein
MKKNYSHVDNYLLHQHAKKNLFRYFIFWATQKWQTSRSDYVYFISTNFIRFYVAYNIKNFVMKFCIFVDYIIDYI